MEKKGFTLVELSIVLVVIGLLIGGILTAQSMISTSKITAVVAQIQQFDAGVMSFKTKYNYLPGDAPGFGGDGNGNITTTGYGSRTHIFLGEIANFWYNFDSSQFSNPISNPPIYIGSNKNVPISKLGSNNSFF